MDELPALITKIFISLSPKMFSNRNVGLYRTGKPGQSRKKEKCSPELSCSFCRNKIMAIDVFYG
jgi:hypothetical protein